MFSTEALSDILFPASSPFVFVGEDLFLFGIILVILQNTFIGKINKVSLSVLSQNEQGLFKSALLQTFSEKLVIPGIILVIGKGW